MGEEANWLRDRLGEVGGVVRAYIFGSFCRGECSPKDVDIVVVFRTLDAVDNLSELRKVFRKRFGLPLHVQKFYEQQGALIDSFMRRAGASEKIYG